MKKVLLLFMLMFSTAAFAADTKVSDMTAASALGGTELFHCVQSSADRKCTITQVGTRVIAQDGELSSIAGLTSAADKVPYYTGSGTADVATFTAFGRSIVDDADEATFKATVNLEAGTDFNAYDADLAAIAGLTSAADKGIMFTGSGTAAVYTLTAAGLALLDDAAASNQRTTLDVPDKDQTFQWSGMIETPADKTYHISVDTAFAGTITEVVTDADSGTGTWTCSIGATPLGGTANSVSSTETAQAHASANAFVAGDEISCAITSNSALDDMRFKIEYTRALAQ